MGIACRSIPGVGQVGEPQTRVRHTGHTARTESTKRAAVVVFEGPAGTSPSTPRSRALRSRAAHSAFAAPPSRECDTPSPAQSQTIERPYDRTRAGRVDRGSALSARRCILRGPWQYPRRSALGCSMPLAGPACRSSSWRPTLPMLTRRPFAGFTVIPWRRRPTPCCWRARSLRSASCCASSLVATDWM